MHPSLFVILVLLSSPSSKSAANHETFETPDDTEEASAVSQRSEVNNSGVRFGIRSKGDHKNSEPVELPSVAAQPNQYEGILVHARRLFERAEGSTNDPADSEIIRDRKEVPAHNGTVEGDRFSTSDVIRKRNSSPVEGEGNEEKYSPRNPDRVVSLRTTVENNAEVDKVAPAMGNNDVTEGRNEPDDQDLVEAANFGLDAMKDLYTVKEPMLYSMGLYLESDNPARHVAVFNDQTEEARTLAKYGFAVLQGTTMFRRKFPDAPTDSLLTRRSQSNPLQRGCPNRGVPDCPPASLRYRTSDGSCNNLQQLWWGSAMSTMQRFLPPVYDDGIQSIRRSVTGRPLPSPRRVSMTIHVDRDIPLASVTHMLMQWGQFVDHDLTATGQSRGFNGTVPQCCLKFGSGFQPPEFMHPECLPIEVDPRDSFLGPLRVRCLEFLRSGPAPKENCEFGPREQLTQVTSFLDASTVYSSNAFQMDSLRLFRNGLLQYGKVQSQRPQLPRLEFDLCKRGSLSTSCFRAGDGRVGEQPALTSLHVVFLRLHNRIATKLAALNTHWNDEKLFQESRRIVGAIVQHITYREFLPIVLGQDVMQIFELVPLKNDYYEDYDPTVNPTVANAFSTAAYRFGHSLVQHSFVRFDSDHRPIFDNVSIHNEFTNSANLETAGSVDRLLLGLINQPAQRRDEHISEELTNHLFQTPNFPFGMDLASINVQRGRDHGIPPYVQWREPCGLSPIKNFVDLQRIMPAATARKFRQVYSSVEDIDLFTGGLAEKSVRGGLVGPTFACIIGQQFSNLRKGDRFWYENSREGSFAPAQLRQIRRATLAQVLCTTMDDIDTVQPFVFLTHDTLKNQRVPCNDPLIGQLDLDFWAERSQDQQFQSRAGILDKVLRRTTQASATTPKPTTTPKWNKFRDREGPAENRFNIPSITNGPPKASIHQTNKIFVKRPFGPADNYTILVQNNAINSPVFVNDAVHSSAIKISPSLNQQAQQRPEPQEPPVGPPVLLPPPRPVPVTHPLDHVYVPRPYVPYTYNDPSNPNPLSQGYQAGYASRDVLFENYSGTSPRPTLYTYYTNFQRQTTPRPPQDVDAYLINYSRDNEKDESAGSPLPYQTEELPRPGYSSSGSQQSYSQGSKYQEDSGFQGRPYRPAGVPLDRLKDSPNRYQSGSEHVTRGQSNLSYDKKKDAVNDQHQTSRPSYQRPAEAYPNTGTIPAYQKVSTDSNRLYDEKYQSRFPTSTVHFNPVYPSSAARPTPNYEAVRNSNGYPSSTLHTIAAYKPVRIDPQTDTSAYQGLAASKPSKVHSVTIVTEPTMSEAGYGIDRLENRVTGEIPKPIGQRIDNGTARKPGQYYYEKNVLHRYPDPDPDPDPDPEPNPAPVASREETRDVDRRRETAEKDVPIDPTFFDASVRKQQVINAIVGNDTGIATMKQSRNESADSLANIHADREYLEEISGEFYTDARDGNRTNHWPKPQRDSSLPSTMGVPKVPSNKDTAANELPRPIKLRNNAS